MTPFDTRVALLIRDDLMVWQKLNVAAFLATGIAGAAPEAMGAEPYRDAAGREHARLLAQPMLIFAADTAQLAHAWRVALERDLTRAVYVEAMFASTHDEANREVFLAEDPEAPHFVGLALRGPRKGIEKATKGLRLHP
ncbi:DUF2000 family protein [Luteibacter yeojuensis]|uniref:DUF2000 family protein n=1 Tax=Luteibacter yeojuensis TaxID=345309 RepID=A0A0F3L041_9GAMM|nr:DUF2000 family protein [Luteibacter yeojuensis]KJV35724.1 hypothetical protein VI08_06925 [Luteibacter yeojuensis]